MKHEIVIYCPNKNTTITIALTGTSEEFEDAIGRLNQIAASSYCEFFANETLLHLVQSAHTWLKFIENERQQRDVKKIKNQP